LDRVTPIEILLVEDNVADVRLTREMLKDAKVANRVSVVSDGEAAIAFLRQQDVYRDSPKPDLVLLDLNLPRKDGREVLEEIKEDEELRTIPVVVVTTSSAEADVFSSYYNHANAYVTKPVDLDAFVKVVKAIEDFWLAVVKLPDAHPA
jgi:two-component system, chemotaxis family, response regulator Rcp1